jgi:glutathione S-transferase
MSVVLYYASGSPYAWRAWLALAHKGAAFELKLLSFDAGDLEQPDFARLNPRRKVPVLVDGTFVLRESAAIVEYVAERFTDGPPLFAPDIQTRAIQRQTIREIDAYVAPAIEHVAEAAIYAERPDPTAIAAAVASLREELARWDAVLTGDFLAGSLSAADFTLYPFVARGQRFARRVPDAPADLLGPKLTAWANRLSALPAVRATWPPHWR